MNTARQSDLTENEKSEADTIIEALNRSQEIVQYHPDGTIISANKIFLETFGYTLSEIEGRSHSDFCDEESTKTQQYKELWSNLRRGESQSGEFKRIGKGGKELWLISSFVPVNGSDGKLQKIIEISRDITDTKAELKVRTDIMNLTSIVSESDLKGNILTINEKFLEVSKYSRDELIGQPHNTTRHPDMPKAVFKEMWSTIGRGKIFRGVVKNRAKDGTPYYVDAVIAPIIGEN